LRKAEELFTYISEELRKKDGIPNKFIGISSSETVTSSVAEVYNERSSAVVTKRLDIPGLVVTQSTNVTIEQNNGAETVLTIDDSLQVEEKDLTRVIEDTSEEEDEEAQVFAKVALSLSQIDLNVDQNEISEEAILEKSTECLSVVELPILQSVFGCEEAEPKLTNKTEEFEGILDYIFLSPLLHPISAAALPILLSDEKLSEIEINEVIVEMVDSCLNRKVEGAQPSKLWPSDHLAIISDLQIE
jgi:hypothetical protein